MSPVSDQSPELKGSASGKTAEDINEFFSSIDKEETPPIGDKEEKPDKEEEKPDKDEADEDEEKPDDIDLVEDEDDVEKLDLSKPEAEIEVDAPPRKKEILKEYPELFKKFPFLEKMLYRDRQYSELFGSFDDAKEIADKSEVFNAFEQQLLSGNTEQILREVKETDEGAFKTIVDDYLTTLHKVDKDAYLHVTGNLNKRLIMEMWQEAEESKNDELKQAALIVNQFVFGTSKFTAPTRLSDNKPAAKDEAAEKERLNFVKERYDTAREDLQGKVDNTLRATISEHIDPRGNMSSYVKKNAVNDAMTFLNDALDKDPTVVKNLNKLWRSAFDNKFSKDSLDRIRSFYLSKAKGQLKTAIIKARAEALKDTPSRSRERQEKEESDEKATRQRTISPGRPSQPKSKNEIKKGESVTEYFMRD